MAELLSVLGLGRCAHGACFSHLGCGVTHVQHCHWGCSPEPLYPKILLALSRIDVVDGPHG